MNKSNFKWLGSNVRNSATNELFNTVVDSDIFEVVINKHTNSDSNIDSNAHNIKSKTNSLESLVSTSSNCTDSECLNIDDNDNTNNTINTSNTAVSNSTGTTTAVDNDGNNSDSSDQKPAIARVGVFGVCTQFTPLLSDPGEEVVFEDALEHAKRCVEYLHGEKCDFIMALTHLELESDKKIAEIEGVDVIIGEKM